MSLGLRGSRACAAVAAVATLVACGDGGPGDGRGTSTGPDGEWSQWGGRGSHDGAAPVAAQDPSAILATLVVDPFAAAEAADSRRGALLVHFQAPLLDGDDLFMTVKSGSWTACEPPGSGQPAPCGALAWSSQVWNVGRWSWRSGALEPRWTAASDWKPVPDAGALAAWEPVFHPVLARGSVWVPGAGGSVLQLDRETGRVLGRVSPLPGGADTYVVSPLTADASGNIYYTALQLDPADPWRSDARGAWLVKVPAVGQAAAVSFAALTPGAPGASAACRGQFSGAELPWPPAPDAVPPSAPCGSQRPGLNVAPAVADDGTVYLVSRAHFNGRYGYLVAATPGLAPLWAASLRDRLSDGCGSAVLPDGAPGACRAGARPGVDPATNEPPAGIVTDLSSSSPVVAPDGSVLYGAYSRYNGARGHLFRFSAAGAFVGAYDYGWDVTPAVYRHDGTWSIVVKDNHYEAGSYCSHPTFCPAPEGGPFRITQLSPDMQVEWSFAPEPTPACQRGPDGAVACSDETVAEPEWCINAPVVDANGTVMAINEDGHLYAIAQGGTLLRRTFLARAIGAAYTPLAVDAAGRTYAQNYGQLFVLGAP